MHYNVLGETSNIHYITVLMASS